METATISVSKALLSVRLALQRIFLKPSRPSVATFVPPTQDQPVSRYMLLVGVGSLLLLHSIMWLLYVAELYVPLLMIGLLTFGFFLLLLIYVQNSWLLRGWRWYRRTNRRMIETRFTPMDLPPKYRRWVRLVYLVEIVLIALVALVVTKPYQNLDKNQRLAGIEQEWLTSSAFQSAQSLKEKGYIALWQPYLEYGEPLVENPFAFVFNPLSTLPSLIVGAVNGVKISIVVYVIFTGLGGWVLGRVLGFGSVGRVLLALLLIGKGNMHGMLEGGYFQLGISQAYMPWIIAGAIATIRHWNERWSPILLAVMVALMFFAGNIWYLLPMLASVVLLALSHLFLFQGKTINYPMLRRLIWAGIMTFGLTAVILIPLWERRDLIGDHPSLKDGGLRVELKAVIEEFYNGDDARYYDERAPGDTTLVNRYIFYYSYVAPLSFLILIFGMILPFQPFLYVPGIRQGWRIWTVGIVVILFCTLWGAGQNPVMAWAYQRSELLGQWRFVGRALGMASFWLAVLIAMRVDGLAQAIVHPYWRQKAIRQVWVFSVQIILLAALVDTAYSATEKVNDQWNVFNDTVQVDPLDIVCVRWLREQFPNEPMTIYRPGYDVMYPYMQYHVRQFGIESDFRVLPVPFTIGQSDLTRLWPRYAVAWDDLQREAISRVGYRPVVGGPTRQGEAKYCLYERDDFVPYAFTAPVDVIRDMPVITNERPYDAAVFRPIDNVNHEIDRVRLQTYGDPEGELVVSVSELAYPGWEVAVNGDMAKIESVGGQIGVVLPPSERLYTIEFAYRPKLVYRYGALSVGMMVFGILYLLRAERLVIKGFRQLRPTNQLANKDVLDRSELDVAETNQLD